MNNTLEKILHNIAVELNSAGIDESTVEASRLVEHVTDKTRMEIILDSNEPVSAEQQEQLEEFVQRRIKKEPLAYIIGEQDFWGFTFKIRDGVLVPRSDSETLIAVLLNLLPDKKVTATMADIGVGSGCLLLSILSEYPNMKGIGVDISKIALGVTEDNAENLGLTDRVELVHGSGAKALLDEKISIIISNPPYIETDDIKNLMAEVSKYEPKEALDGGKDGLDVYRYLIPQAYDRLHSGGLLLLEIGHTQNESVTNLLEEKQWQEITCYQDLAGRDRVIAAIRR